MEKNKKRNELSIFEEFRIKSNTANNKRHSQFFPKESELKKLNVLCSVDKNDTPISWWKKIREEFIQVDEFGQFIDQNDPRYLSKIPSEKNLKKNRSKIFVTVNEHNIIKDYWIRDVNENLVQINLKEKKGSLDIEHIIKSWIRNKAIDSVGLEIRSMKKKAYEYSKDELIKLIEAEENKLIKKGGWKALKIAAMSALGISWLPFI